MPFDMCKKHGTMYRIGDGCSVCNEEKQELQKLQRMEDIDKPATKPHPVRKRKKIKNCVRCGNRCYKGELCYSCKNKGNEKPSFAQYCRSVGARKEFKEELSSKKKGDGAVEIKESRQD